MTWLKNGTAVQKVGGKVDVSLDCCCCECGCHHLNLDRGGDLDLVIEGAITATATLVMSSSVQTCFEYFNTTVVPDEDACCANELGSCQVGELHIRMRCKKGANRVEDIELSMSTQFGGLCERFEWSLWKKPDSAYCSEPCNFSAEWTYMIGDPVFCPQCDGQEFTVTISRPCP